MRWTYAADMQPGAYERSEYAVTVSNWIVTGTGRTYQVAGRGSRRYEDDNPSLVYTGTWSPEQGNYSGGTIRSTTAPGSKVALSYYAPDEHRLYVGTRYLAYGSPLRVTVDGGAPVSHSLQLAGEDQLFRLSLGTLPAGQHTVELEQTSSVTTEVLYFDFFEVCFPTMELPEYPSDEKVTLATDWDTDHSIALAPERTAWFLNSLGYHGRANHYVGALWFYELHRPGQVYASATVDFLGTPVFGSTPTVTLTVSGTTLTHTVLIGDTAETMAKAFELLLNNGFTAVWASASGTQLTIQARQMGEVGDSITLAATPATGAFHLELSTDHLTGGEDGTWTTDLTAIPRINRAARDWSKAYFEALAGYGVTNITAAFSTELQHGDPSEAAGIAQRYPDNTPVLVNTPALQTNFSPESLAYWQQVHLEMAQIMVAAGIEPFLQFGEVQWWYFPKTGVGMTFYDAHTKAAFQSAYGHPMAIILSNDADPALYPDEAAFLPTVIGAFTDAASAFVRASVPECKFEVLYPLDVNDFAFTRVINYAPVWTPAHLDALKTESFGYTFERNLDKSAATRAHGALYGFARHQRAFLVGVGDPFSPWLREVDAAKADNLESIVLWALDQYCLLGHLTPLAEFSRSSGQGS
jgi:hypothetical protein